MEVEEFAPINGYEGIYSVSNFGRVISHDRYAPHARHGTIKVYGRMLKTPINSHGYQHVNLCLNNKQDKRKVHRLVAEIFVPKTSIGDIVNHIDGNRANPFWKNLEWVTHAENIYHAQTVLRTFVGSKIRDRIDDETIKAIRLEFPYATNKSALARKYGISKTMVYDIVNGKRRRRT